MSVTTAESCTGGLIASLIAREAGSSQVFGSGFVTYSNAAKHSLLSVPEETLAQYGAVSEPVVLAMLTGALENSGSDIGIAVSGIAGPGGGSDDKPVGTVWIAWGTSASPGHSTAGAGHRERFQILVAAIGLDILRRQLLKLPPIPHYIQRFIQPHHDLWLQAERLQPLGTGRQTGRVIDPLHPAKTQFAQGQSKATPMRWSRYVGGIEHI